jgi:hypothetical protein
LQLIENRLGGQDAIDGLQSLHVVAECSGPDGAFTNQVDSQRPDRTYLRQEGSDFTMELWTTVDRTWGRNPAGVLVNAPPGARSMARGHEFHLLFLELGERFSDFAVAGSSEVGETPCTQMTMTDEDGYPASICVAEDGLPLELVLNPPGAAGAVRIEPTAWNNINNVLFVQAFVLSEGPDRQFTYDYVEIQPDAVPDHDWTPPPG